MSSSGSFVMEPTGNNLVWNKFQLVLKIFHFWKLCRYYSKEAFQAKCGRLNKIFQGIKELVIFWTGNAHTKLKMEECTTNIDFGYSGVIR
jgi:hypothetical protein